MLQLIPAPLHRVLYRVAHALRRQWWRVRRPRRSSVVVVAFDEQDRVLLVRHSYGPPVWSLPGGGIDRGEDAVRAAAREVREELGCGLADLTAIDASEERIAGSFDMRHIFVARLAGEPVPDMREIVEVAFFEPEDLPERCGRRSRERIRQAVAHRRAGTPGSEQR
jgi:8-oxo-dGTP pyrophosphatase MutT (NUDIX family)